jgi:hypothetical protein
MAISRAQLAKELEPGLNALFGLEYDRYEKESEEIFETESSDRAFEEEVMLSGFGTAPVRAKVLQYHLMMRRKLSLLDTRTKPLLLLLALLKKQLKTICTTVLLPGTPVLLARSMSQTKQIKAASILNNAFSTSFPVGDGAALCSSAHPSLSGNQRNLLSTAADLNETSLEQMLIDIAGLTDERGLKIAVRGTKLIIPKELQFIAERVLNSNLRPGTADNDINANRSMGMLPDGAVVNHFLTDTDAFFIKTDAPNGFKMFNRAAIKTAMEGDFDTGNMRFKARERYSFGVSDWRCVFGTPGA